MKDLKDIGCQSRSNGGNSVGAVAGLFFLFGLLGGAYLIVMALANPMQGSDLEVLGGGFILALSSFLLVYFVRPQNKGTEMRRSKETPAPVELDEAFEHTPEVIAAD
jgi:hypothetical protein